MYLQDQKLSDIAKNIKTCGYHVYPNMFDNSSCLIYRDLIYRALMHTGIRSNLGIVSPFPLLAIPELANIVFSKPVLQIAQKILGEDCIFSMHSDIHLNMCSNWHKDTDAYQSDVLCCENVECYAIKFAMFFNETDKDAFTIRNGSWCRPPSKNEHGLDVMPLRANPGDLIIFDVRSDHRGMIASKIELFFNKLTFGRYSSAKNFFTSIDNSRIAIFFTYVKNNRYGHDFAQLNYERSRREFEMANQNFSLEKLYTVVEGKPVYRVIE